ncbi:MAG: methyl-accepting chemotaxis protein [Candidatus Cohnella colombiensis]|uniref:Methyl-accepting chemotaxis protein n=1 Tax=Candidatus Cohnella colombiensis TaxID=3121368 RepID=A0AA95JB15_9BACL|nr:MAG: methyl-accepting chemotaxis protein [Cohnella sp.]
MRNFFKNFTIQKKLYSGFGLVLLLLAIMSTVSYEYLLKVNSSYTHLLRDQSTTLQLIKDLKIAVEGESSSLSRFLLTGDENNLESYNVASTNFSNALTELKNLITDRDDKQIIAGLDLLQDQYTSAGAQMVDAKNRGKEDVFKDILMKQANVLDTFIHTSDRFVKMKQESLNNEAQSTHQEVERIKTWVILLTLATLIVGLVASISISRAISKPIIKLHAMASKIADGDLRDTQIVVKNRDEIGKLVSVFNLMTANLRQLIHEVGSHAEQVAASSEQLNASADQTGQATEYVANISEKLAEGTELQVQTIEDSLILVNKMDDEARNIAIRASRVTESALNASQVASEGGIAVQSAINQMTAVQASIVDVTKTVTALGEKTKEIGTIIALITDIAAQTNLLALNAAIEAARAGENGRGFAVVAGEVRKLAEQTAQSGKQVSEVISAIQAETEYTITKVVHGEKEALAGLHAVNNAGISFTQIEDSIREVNVQIKEVDEYSGEMSIDTQQLVSAFEGISKLTHSAAESTHGVSASAQQQLASVEEITAASKELADLAQQLQESIEKFAV